MSIVEFLEARLAEDEAETRSRFDLYRDDEWPKDFEATLREVAAKRAIVADYRELRDEAKRLHAEGSPMVDTARSMYAGLEIAMQSLAAVCSDHPDFDPAWAVEAAVVQR